ncbi:MAG: ATP-binding protein [Bacteroidales bacterium]|jgi:hypothetical protein|nr:ATP-binding protein [Bacteroidales bacterium]
MKKLPTGIQDFEYLRVNDYVYVDKTEFIYKSLQGGKSLFLGRPRRFGKSLFLSTLKYYFLGRKDLFKGLYIEQLTRKHNLSFDAAAFEMKKRYDGYHFAVHSADMYNPFSVLNTLESRDFGYYWYETGTPTFLVKIMQMQNVDVARLKNNVRTSRNDMFNYRAVNDDITSLLYQSGYLTIKDYDSTFDEFILGFPNEEVKYGFLNDLLLIYVPDYMSDRGLSATRFAQDLMEGRIDDFLQRLRSFYKNIPYDITEKKEKYFQSIFWTLLTLAGRFVDVEQVAADGRIDAVVKTEKKIYVFEFKTDGNADAQDALAQIDSKEYAIPFAFDGRDIVKVGVVFGADDRRVKEWAIGQ